MSGRHVPTLHRRLLGIRDGVRNGGRRGQGVYRTRRLAALAMASRLLGRAKPNHDNYTAAAVFFRSPTAPLPQRRARGASGTKQSRSSLTEQLSWLAVVCLTATLMMFLAANVFAEPLAQALAKRNLSVPWAHRRASGASKNGVKRSDTAAPKRTD